ncbi:MAG TPA: class I SAM-dependent methyltransferase [Allosphingosinicella sp.]|jgi:2-polyprenyl-3-methyl-5-hydroxy-6-metoxy-1,4-benzoquinol methylase
MLDREPLTDCPLCGSSLAGDRVRRLSGFEKDHLVECRTCGFVFSLLKPNEQDYERVYGSYDYVSEDDRRTPLSIDKEREVAKRLLAYKKTGKVIDLAAGAGRFLEHFRELGFECHATEFSEEMCGYLEAKGFRTHRGGLFPETAEKASFDIAIFTEIIEHINNPIPVLQTICDLLRPGGCIYITTPNFASIERRVIGPSWGMLTWPEHITYWTPRHIQHALRKTGFRKASIRTQNISPYRIVQALKKGRMSSVVSGVSEQGFSDAAQEKVAGSPLLRAAKQAINWGLGATGTGSSIEAIYVKRG